MKNFGDCGLEKKMWQREKNVSKKKEWSNIAKRLTMIWTET